jgi:hypothetical protein
MAGWLPVDVVDHVDSEDHSVPSRPARHVARWFYGLARHGLFDLTRSDYPTGPPVSTQVLSGAFAAVVPRGDRTPILEYEEEAELHEAGAVIANSYLRLDHQEWIRVVEKRSAALQGR